MLITKKHLPRRTVLRGIGATIALPLLDGMVPALTAISRTAAAPIKRLGVFYVPNGMSMPYWFPKTAGSMENLPPTLQSLNHMKERVLLCGGLDDEPANLVKGGGDHARSAGTFLTGVPFKITNGADVYAAVSMDQMAARELSKETQIASLELGHRVERDGGQLATAARVAPTPTPSPGGRRPPRCRSRTIRARCSSGCSGPAAAPTRRRAGSGCAATAASSTRSVRSWRIWGGSSDRATR